MSVCVHVCAHEEDGDNFQGSVLSLHWKLGLRVCAASAFTHWPISPAPSSTFGVYLWSNQFVLMWDYPMHAVNSIV